MKGKHEPTCIYELIGWCHDELAPGPQPLALERVSSTMSRVSTVVVDAMNESSVSMRHSIDSLFGPIRRWMGRTSSRLSTEGSLSRSNRRANTINDVGAIASWVSAGGGALDELPEDHGISARQRQTVRMYEDALRAYQEARFPEARDLLRALLAVNPGDVPTLKLLERTCQYIGPDGVVRMTLNERASWTGVNRMTDK